MEANDNDPQGRSTGRTIGNSALAFAVVERDLPEAAVLCPIRFQCQWQDEETGLSYNRFRYYDQLTAQYITNDPIGIFGGVRLYGYVTAPSVWLDPFGLAQVDATFTINGQTFTGANPTERVGRDFGSTLPSLNRPPNNESFTSHAEIDAMQQAYDQGIRGGDGVLTVSGENVCSYCRGDVKSAARDLGLDNLTVKDADGNVYKFNKDELNKMKDGGSSWKDAKCCP